MPSGFTAPLYEGEQDFTAFVLRCARGVGALITEREEPLNKPLPDRFEPYHTYMTSFVEAEENLLEFLNADDVNRRRLQLEEYNAKLQRIAADNEESRARAERYATMLAQVASWKPPTDDHIGLKKFMIEQLASAIDFDIVIVELPVMEPFENWIEDRVLQLGRARERAARNLQDEQRRCDERTAWVQVLKASLADAGVPAS